MQLKRYTLANQVTQTFQFPEQWNYLCMQVFEDVPYLWIIADPATPLVTVRIHTYVSEATLPSVLGPYLGTYTLVGVDEAYHVFCEQ